MSLEAAVARVQLADACRQEGIRGLCYVTFAPGQRLVHVWTNTGNPFQLVRFDAKHLTDIFQQSTITLYVD